MPRSCCCDARPAWLTGGPTPGWPRSLVLLRSRNILVTGDTRSRRPAARLIRRGCRVHAVLTTWVGHGCGSFGGSAALAWLRVSEASVPMVLKCEIGIAEGKPLMEQYELDELAASADAVVAGLGPLAARVAPLAGGAGRGGTRGAGGL